MEIKEKCRKEREDMEYPYRDTLEGAMKRYGLGL
jgi:hypothetical protein